MADPAELVAALRAMAERANTARGASWEHGARSATILLAAADSIVRSQCLLTRFVDAWDDQTPGAWSRWHSAVVDARAFVRGEVRP